MEKEEKYTFKTIIPFKYKSRQAYKRHETAGEFWVMIATIMLIISIVTMMGLAILGLSKSSLFALIGTSISPFIFFAILSCIIWLGVSEYRVGDFIDECIVRYKMRKYPNYIPIEYSAITELNGIVKTQNGELFRKYQFINAEQSGTNHITLQVPKNIVFDTYTVKGKPSVEKMCMFNRLSEMELSDILIPIKQYYEDKEYRAEMERKEAEIKRQSEINSRMTNEDINNLPLFKSMQAIADKTEQDNNKYHKEMQSNLKDNQAIAENMKSS